MSEVGPIFESAAAELGEPIPDRKAALLEVLKFYVRQIATRAMDPYEGMARIDNDVVDEDYFPNTEYVGDGMGIERMYTWYRELQDAEDGSLLSYYTDLPRHEAVLRFQEHLVEEARQRLRQFEA